MLRIILLTFIISTVYGEDCKDCNLISFPKFFNYITKCSPNERVVITDTFIERTSDSPNFNLDINDGSKSFYSTTNISYLEISKITFNSPLIFLSLSCSFSQRCSLYYSITTKCDTSDYANNTSLIRTDNNIKVIIPLNVVLVNVTLDINYTVFIVPTNTPPTSSSINQSTFLIVSLVLILLALAIPIITCMNWGEQLVKIFI